MDHPRACGENFDASFDGLPAPGSPPRMRGKHLINHAHRLVVQITPAHAGKTSSAFACAFLVADHPRACGENRTGFNISLQQLGSPPRMRGKPIRETSQYVNKGITPAHAGKTKTRVCFCLEEGDHPRACGENHDEEYRFLLLHGSPPRMRGKLSLAQVLECSMGITPAHAGKTSLPRPMTSSQRDHPRACGENKVFEYRRTQSAGSPPRMRGKQSLRNSVYMRIGITPAHAGKTKPCNRSDMPVRDHPRACGENQ